MTTTSDAPRPPGLFSKAEAGSRHVILPIGLGIVSFIVGSIFSAGAMTRIYERLGPLDSELTDWLIKLVLERLWLFLFLPACAWAMGRFTEVKPLRFTLMSALSGEAFSLLVLAGMFGFEEVVSDPRSTLGHLVTLLFGMMLTLAAMNEGRAVATQAQQQAAAEAEKRKAEYADYLAKMEAEKDPSPPPQ